jgi:hypothetical protein
MYISGKKNIQDRSHAMIQLVSKREGYTQCIILEKYRIETLQLILLFKKDMGYD